MDRMHSLVPMTEQEEQVNEILNQYAISHYSHVVFPVGSRTYVVDFYLPNQRIAVECWRSTSRRGVALTWVEKNAAYVDLKLRRIKAANPDLRCVALVEVMQAKVELVRRYVGPVMEHADVVCCSMEELARVVRGVVRGWWLRA